MVTDLIQISRLGEQKRGENERFRKHLKRHKWVERRFKAIAQGVEDAIDCQQCANCCRTATVRLIERDVEKLAKYIGARVPEFLANYTDKTEDEGLILRRTESGCVFLEGTTCTVYDARPHNCLHFPHLVSNDGSLTSRMWDMIDRATYCPIVYNTLEAYKVEVDFQTTT